MIKSIVSQSPWLNVNTYNNTPYMPGGLQSSGMVRYNTSMQRLEVYDGNAWSELGGGSTVDLSVAAQTALEWASKKMREEQEWREMSEQHPAIKDAYNKFKQAEEQLKIVQALVQCNN